MVHLLDLNGYLTKIVIGNCSAFNPGWIESCWLKSLQKKINKNWSWKYPLLTRYSSTETRRFSVEDLKRRNVWEYLRFLGFNILQFFDEVFAQKMGTRRKITKGLTAPKRAKAQKVLQDPFHDYFLNFFLVAK